MEGLKKIGAVVTFVFTFSGLSGKGKVKTKVKVKWKANEVTRVERENQTVRFVFRGTNSGCKFRVNSSTL